MADSELEVVGVVGSGSFGSVMARILSLSSSVGEVKLWARRQEVVDEINNKRTNSQYVPLKEGEVLFENKKVVAVNDVTDCIRGASIIFLAVPSEYLNDILSTLLPSLSLAKQNPILVSLIKSFHFDNDSLTTPCIELEGALEKHQQKGSVMTLMGPNIFKEMSREGEFAEATLGCLPQKTNEGERVVNSLTSECFSVELVEDRLGVELCGCLKNVVSLAAGFCEGLGLGANTRAAIIRKGLKEMASFPSSLGLHVEKSTFFECACGVGDLVLTTTAGRGRILASHFVKEREASGVCGSVEKAKQRWSDLQDKHFNGMKLPDQHNAIIVHTALTHHKSLEKFPLFREVYNIAYLDSEPKNILNCLRSSSIVSREPTKLRPFLGKRALVTGAANGIGLEIATHLNRLGAQIVAVDKDEKLLKALPASIPNTTPLPLNLLDFKATMAGIESEIQASGEIDFVVNCAGVAIFQNFFDSTPEAFDLQFGVNVKGLCCVTQAVTKALAKSGRGGSVVNISSQSSTIPLTEHLFYSSSKSAVDHVTRIQALELAQYNIRVNAVRPTVVMTQLALKQWDPEKLKQMENQIPLKRLATPLQVAETVAFLLSDQASMITGETLAVDGGRSMGGNGL